MKKNGFTLIELMIVIAILGILAAIIVPAVNGGLSPQPKPDTICKAGYQFVVTEWVGSYPEEVIQLIDANGNGVPCNVQNFSENSFN